MLWFGEGGAEVMCACCLVAFGGAWLGVLCVIVDSLVFLVVVCKVGCGRIGYFRFHWKFFCCRQTFGLHVALVLSIQVDVQKDGSVACNDKSGNVYSQGGIWILESSLGDFLNL